LRPEELCNNSSIPFSLIPAAPSYFSDYPVDVLITRNSFYTAILPVVTARKEAKELKKRILHKGSGIVNKTSQKRKFSLCFCLILKCKVNNRLRHPGEGI
jgi:hypothetical protein